MTKNFKENLVSYYDEWVPPLNIVSRILHWNSCVNIALLLA